MKMICNFVVAAYLVGGTGAMAQLQAPDHRYYFKERTALQRDTARVAVWSEARQGVLPRIAGENLGVERSGVAPWRVVLTRDGADPTAALREREGLWLSPVFIDDLGGALYFKREIIVGFREDVTDVEARAILAGAGEVVARDWEGMPNVYRVIPDLADGGAVLAKANELAVRDEVRFAEPGMIGSGRGGFIPNDAGFGNCWGLRNTGQSGGTPDADMDADEAWDITTGSSAIKVLVIDTGVQQNHPDINQLPGVDFTGEGGGGGPVNSCDNHGTPVAGCVSATINNSLGTVGVAPGVKSVSARCFISLSNCGGGWDADYGWGVTALNWALANGVRVTNNSNIYGGTSSALTNAYTTTRNAGMVHFACAGNNGSSTLSYPANVSTVNAVAALDRTGVRSSFSQFGPGLDFSAPGREIYSTDRTGGAGYVGGDYVSVQGTSFASPYSAGVAALVLSLHPEFGAPAVEAAMQQGCVDLGSGGYDTGYGWGFVNAKGALVAAGCTPTVSGNPSSVTVGHGSVVVLHGSGAGIGLSYQWLRNGSPVSNDPPRVTGATSTTLTINPAHIADSGSFALRITNPCGTATTNAAAVTVQPTCMMADFDGDGFITGLDYDSFVYAFQDGDSDADFDGDGFLTGQDFDLYVGTFEAGC